MHLQKRITINDPTNRKHPSAHAACVEYHKGERYIAYFSGVLEGSADVDIHIVRGDTNKPVTLGFNNKIHPCWNPILVPTDDYLMLFYKKGKFCDSWQTCLALLETTKEGIKVRMSGNLPAGVHGPVKTKVLKEGNTLICGSSNETSYNWSSHMDVFKIKTVGGYPLLGLSGRSNVIMPGKGTHKAHMKGLLQPAIWKDDEGHYNAFMRSSSDNEFMWHAKSIYTDNPYKWAPATPVNEFNPNSAVAVLKHSNGKTYIAHNPSSTARLPLTVAEFTMTDGRFETHNTIQIESEIKPLPAYEIDNVVIPSNGRRPITAHVRTTREASYPYMTETPDNKIDIVYTYGRREIKLATLEI